VVNALAFGPRGPCLSRGTILLGSSLRQVNYSHFVPSLFSSGKLGHKRECSGLDWIVQRFTSPPTQYRLYGRRFLQVKRPNQQYQSTEGDATKEKAKKENN